ncbi:MAG: FkbM family methyltransferase, partial [Acidobacteriaceae bacterium]
LRTILRPLFGQADYYRASMADVCRHFRGLGFSPATIFDLGVANGTFEVYDVWPDARLILVDPIAEWEKSMKWICSHRRAPACYVVAAAGDHDGETTIGCPGNLTGASIYMHDAQQRTVPMYSLDHLASQFGAHSPYLLKMDVQGAEAMILAGSSEVLPECEVVLLEVRLLNFTGNGMTLVEMIALMASRGFSPFDFYDGLRRPLDRSLGTIDIAFVKTNGRFRQSHVWGSERENARDKIVQRIRMITGI